MIDKAQSRRFSNVEARSNPRVVVELRRWWDAACVHCDKNEHGMVKAALSGAVIDGEVRGDQSLQRDEYEYFYQRLVHAFNHDDDDDNDLNHQEVLSALEIDWMNDSRGEGDVDRVDFEDAVFELVKTW